MRQKWYFGSMVFFLLVGGVSAVFAQWGPAAYFSIWGWALYFDGDWRKT